MSRTSNGGVFPGTLWLPSSMSRACCITAVSAQPGVLYMRRPRQPSEAKSSHLDIRPYYKCCCSWQVDRVVGTATSSSFFPFSTHFLHFFFSRENREVGNCDVSSLPTPSLTYTVTKEDIEIVYIGLVYTYRKDIRRRTYGSPSCPFFVCVSLLR